jgi:hypothetical protein
MSNKLARLTTFARYSVIGSLGGVEARKPSEAISQGNGPQRILYLGPQPHH